MVKFAIITILLDFNENNGDIDKNENNGDIIVFIKEKDILC